MQITPKSTHTSVRPQFSAQYAHDSHSPGRPFLRRQESHSVMRATITKNPPHTPVHPTDHSCEGRNLTIVCRQRRRLLGGMANCGTRHCEIPAYAGMVYLYTGIRGRILALSPHRIVAALPPTNCRPQTKRQSVDNPPSPTAHSCEGRNLLLTGGNTASLIRTPLGDCPSNMSTHICRLTCGGCQKLAADKHIGGN